MPKPPDIAPFAAVQAVVVAGRLGDRHGLKPMLMAGLGLFAVAALLCGTATNLWLLIGARGLQGIGAAFLMTLSLALMRQTALVVGPFYLGLGLGLKATLVGLLLTIGPVITIVSGVPSGRLVDSRGSGRVLAIGLTLLTAGAFLLAILPGLVGVVGYQLFQAANNTAALTDVPGDRHGWVSGLLSLSRNIGLIPVTV